MALIYDVVDVQELTGFVRGVQLERELNVFQLSRFLPNENIDDIEYRVDKLGSLCVMTLGPMITGA